MQTYINKKVIIRANRAGVFYGTLTEKENTLSGVEVKLTNCRRFWYWEGAASLSQLAIEGVTKPKACKFTVIVPEMVIEDAIEIIPVSEAATENIEAVATWKL